MNLRPVDTRIGHELKTDAQKVVADRAFMAHFQVPASKATVASTTGIHAAAATSGTVATDITTGFTQPSVPRNITATAGGTAADIKAVQVIVEGTNMNDEAITETLAAFTVDTAGTVTGAKAFKSVTKVTVPAMDGAAATVAVGFGEVLGLPYKLPHNTVLHAFRNNTRESTAPTVATSSTALESNTFDLNSALNSSVVDIYLMV